MATATKAKPATKKANTGKTVAGVKIAKKKVSVRRAHLADEKYTGGEPQWDTERALAMSDADFDHNLRRSFYYYNYHFTVKDLKPDFIKWLQEQKHFTVSKTDLSKVIKSRWVPITACSIIAAHGRGMPLKPRALQYLETAVRDVCEKYIEDDSDAVPETKTATIAVKVPTIQDRLNEKTSEILGELDGHYDDVCLGKTDFKHYDFLVANNVVQSQLGKYEDRFLPIKAELEEAKLGKDEQLKEGYSHYKAADFKRIIAWIDQLLQAVDQYRDVKKATKKARVKRAPSKEKLVAKLKYAKEEKTLKLVSVNPVDIIGSQELWVYNIKTRKLGRYVAASYQALALKGTTLINFDETKSIAKTLRKPEVQVPEFMKSTKVQLRKHLDTIKATETLLTGRINEDTVLLKVA